MDARVEQEFVTADRRVQKVIADSDDMQNIGAPVPLTFLPELRNSRRFCAAHLALDAYILMALQLALYKNQQCFTAAYETALTWLFRNSPMETIKTLTSVGGALVLSTVDPSATVHCLFPGARLHLGTYISQSPVDHAAAAPSDCGPEPYPTNSRGKTEERFRPAST